jgi:hypothetical protein
VSKAFAALDQTHSRLRDQIADHVATGDATSVLSTIAATPAIAQRWRQRGNYYPRRDDTGLFAPGLDWEAAQMRRLGEVHAALEPISYDYGYFGTKKSPDWLRHVVGVWLGHNIRNRPLETLVALCAEEGGGGTFGVCDVLFCRDAAHYGSNNSIDRFAGVDAWLANNVDAVSRAVGALDADVRASFAGAVGRFKLAGPYLDALLDLAIGSSKKARAAARQALTGAPSATLRDALSARYAGAAASARCELIETAGALGEQSRTLLLAWRDEEQAAAPCAALDRMLGAAGPAAAPEADGRADGAEGYIAVDGDYVAAPAMPELPGATPIPAALFETLRPAMAAFNAKLAQGRIEAAQLQNKGDRAWHWSRQFGERGADDIALLRKLGESTYLIGNQQRTVFGWMQMPQGRHPALNAFFDSPELTLWHAVRFALANSSGYFPTIFSDWSGAAGASLAKRIAQGADLRVVLKLWTQQGGRDPIQDHLGSYWYQPIAEMGGALWPLLCERFALLDEALGLRPQSGGAALSLRGALDLIALFPKLPQRYQPALMLLASGSSATLAKQARTLLDGTPGIDDAIAALLGDGKGDVRAGAARWLLRRGAADRSADLRAALTRERSDAARAAIITAIEGLGGDVSDLFDPARMQQEAKTGLAKTKVKGLAWFPFDQLPRLHWRDGTPVDPDLPRWWITLGAKLKQPGGDALIDLWLDRLAPGDAHRLGWMVLTSWIEEDTRTCTAEEANAYAAQNVTAVLQQNRQNIQRWPQSASYFPTDRDVVFEQLRRQQLGTYLGSAADSKGILALATRVEGADVARRVKAFLKDHGQRTSQAKALLDVAASNPSTAALQVVLAAANRSKQRSVQTHATELVQTVADRRGWTPEQLADRTVPTGGLDADGTLDLDCGRDRTYTLRLAADDTLALFNPDGAEVKTLPGPRVDEEKPLLDDAKKKVSTARKEVKLVLATQVGRLREAMCLGREWPVEDWTTFVVGHPLVGRLAARLVWLGHDHDAVPVNEFRPLGDSSYTDAGDEEVALEGIATIRLAHQSLLTAEAVAAWRAHLADYEIEPPFDQIGRELPRYEPADGKKRTIDDREGWMIESFKLRGIAAKLGYGRGPAGDGGWFCTYERPFREAGIIAEIEFTGSPLPEENIPAAFHHLCFRRQSTGGYGGRQLALDEVPPVLLAECWQDLHDMADKGAGFDPEWQKKAGL